MAKTENTRCVVKSRIRGLEIDGKAVKVGDIIAVDPEGQFGELIRPGVLEPVVEAADNDSPEPKASAKKQQTKGA